MPTDFKKAKQNEFGVYWLNIGTKIVLGRLVNEEAGLFQLMSNTKIGTDWWPIQDRPGWFTKEEFAENLIFF